MSEKTRFRIIDCLLLAGTVAPFLGAMLLKILFVPAAEGISVSGAYIFFTIPLPLGGLPITESQVNSAAVLLCVLCLSLFLTHGIRTRRITARQVLAEWIVEQTDKLVRGNMGEYFAAFSPFIGGVLGLSALSSLSSLLGLYPPTSDLNIVGGWALLVFILITYYKMKCGFVHYLGSFTEPVAFLLPINIVSEVATPVSMAFRHFGNVLSGSVIALLVGSALGGLTNIIASVIAGAVVEIPPILRIGLPAVLSLYFDLFSSGLQAFIFAMLTMLYVSGAFPMEDYFARKQLKKSNKQKT